MSPSQGGHRALGTAPPDCCRQRRRLARVSVPGALRPGCGWAGLALRAALSEMGGGAWQQSPQAAQGRFCPAAPPSANSQAGSQALPCPLWTTPAGPPGLLLVSRSSSALHPAWKPPGDTITPPVSSQKAFKLLHPAPWTPSRAVAPVGWLSSPCEGHAGWPRSGQALSLEGLYQAWWEKVPDRCDFPLPLPWPRRPGAPAVVMVLRPGDAVCVRLLRRAWVLSSHWRLPASGSCGRHWTRQILCRRTDPALGPAELSACPLTSPGHGAPERA